MIRKQFLLFISQQRKCGWDYFFFILLLTVKIKCDYIPYKLKDEKKLNLDATEWKGQAVSIGFPFYGCIWQPLENAVGFSLCRGIAMRTFV